MRWHCFGLSTCRNKVKASAQAISPSATFTTSRSAWVRARQRKASSPASSGKTAAVKRYHHEDGRWPQAVTGITDEAGVRYGTYAYDAQGRVTRSELAGGADGWTSPTPATPPASPPPPSPTTRRRRRATLPQLHLRRHRQRQLPEQPDRPVQPVRQHPSTKQLRRSRKPPKNIAHDGSVTFIAYDAKGRETERATFPSS